MKAHTLESQLDTLLSAVFQPEASSQQTFECVDRLLSIFKQAGSTRPEASSLSTMFIDEEYVNN